MGAEHVRPAREVPAVRETAVASPRRLTIQAKLQVGRADDPLEREADRVADEIMRSLGATDWSETRIHPMDSGADAGHSDLGGPASAR